VCGFFEWSAFLCVSVGLAVCVVLVAVVVVGKYLYRVLHGLLLADRTGVWRIQEGDYI
jgi:hypothetical protein